MLNALSLELSGSSAEAIARIRRNASEHLTGQNLTESPEKAGQNQGKMMYGTDKGTLIGSTVSHHQTYQTDLGDFA